MEIFYGNKDNGNIETWMKQLIVTFVKDMKLNELKHLTSLRLILILFVVQI